MSGVGERISQLAQGAKTRVSKGWGIYEEGGTTKAAQIDVCCEAVDKDAPHCNTLAYDLAQSYYFAGNMCQDYMFFCRNWHTLLGIFMCHPAHPWSKRERLLMFIITVEITMIPAAAISKLATEDSLELHSQSGYNHLTFTFVTIPNIIVGIILYQVAVADFRCPNAFGCCLRALRGCCFCGAIAYGVFASLACCLILVGANQEMGEDDWRRAFAHLMRGQFYSWVLWFPIWFFMPCQFGFLSLWCAEKRKAKSGQNGDAALPSTYGKHRQPDSVV
jgi:hypothetical protein